MHRLVDIERLGQVLEGAALESGDRRVEVGVGGHDDDRHGGMALLDGLQQLQAREPGHADVRDEDLGSAARKRVERLLRRGERVEVDALARERLLDHPADGAVVVDDPDRFHVSGSRILKTVRPGRLSHSITPPWY
ncbi:hypothetical protein D3C83_18260 [compost metagenome]